MAAGALVRQSPRDQGTVAAGAPGKWPAALHVSTLAGSLAFWAWTDRKLWFFGDEWDFLVRRGLSFPPGSHRSIWSPHNEHWSTLPVLLWRGLYSIFHLSSYWPYLVPLLLVGAGVVHLAWRLALRAGADPWVATFAAGLLAFLGAGASDMTSAFQVTFVSSVLFGLAALLLIDNPGPSNWRRDALASLCLLAALMCSTVGDAMVAGAAVVLVARRPWRNVLSLLALPVVSYAVWFSFLGRPSVSAPRDHFSLTTFTTLPTYVLFGLAGAMGQSFDAASAGAVLLVGLAAWVAWRLGALWREAPTLLGLMSATVAFYLLAGVGRDQTAGAFTVVSRYVWVAMAVLAPVVGRALSPGPREQARPGLRVAVCALLSAAALGNVGQTGGWVNSQVRERSALKEQLVAIGRLLSRGVRDVSGPGASPLQLYPDLSVASIEQLERAHLLPTRPSSALVNAEARAVLALGTWDGSKTALTGSPLLGGKFTLVRAVRAVVSPAGAGCLSFAPASPRPDMQIWLRSPARAGASLALVSAPAASGLVNYVAATLLPATGPVAPPVQLAVPPAGHGYLSDNVAGTEVALSWDVGTPLVACGLRLSSWSGSAATRS